MHVSSTPFPQAGSGRCIRVQQSYNETLATHLAKLTARVVLLALVYLVLPSTGIAASTALLFRLYLTDGTSVVSYGEFARAGDRVIFSMVMGSGDEPRLHVASLPVSAIDWARTDVDAASTRFQWYAQARGEEDFERLSGDVASVLNAVVRSDNPAQVLERAQHARVTVAEWARTHYGYRQQDVREIMAILDEAIAQLRGAAGVSSFNVSLVATTASELALDPVAQMPSIRAQIDQAFHVAMLTDAPAERVALLQAGLQLLAAEGAVIPRSDAVQLRRFAETRIRTEQAIDLRYSTMARRFMSEAIQGATRARIADVQRVLAQIPREDARLGRSRPEVVQALRASVEGQLDAARQLRLRRDQWLIRRQLYSDYQRRVGSQMLQLAKLQPALESIRRLEGPAPEALVGLEARLLGGAERLERIQPPSDLRATHDLLLGAWRFAQTAVSGRYAAARSANVQGAWEAASSAAGALLLYTRAQEQLKTFLEPPRLQ